MAFTIGILKDGSNDFYPITKADCVDGLSSFLAGIPMELVTAMPQNGLDANVFYFFIQALSGNVTFSINMSSLSQTMANVFHFVFFTGSTAPTITWPQDVAAWMDGEAPTINANRLYEVSFITVEGFLGICIEYDIGLE